MEYQDEVRSIWSSGVKHASAAEQRDTRGGERILSAPAAAAPNLGLKS